MTRLLIASACTDIYTYAYMHISIYTHTPGGNAIGKKIPKPQC